MAFYTTLRWRGPGLGSTTTTGSSQVQAIANAISVAEGYGQPGAIPTVRNNPGDLVSGGQIATYPTAQAGWDALYSQINAMISGSSAYYNPNMTWSQIGAIYAQDPSGTWASNVATVLGVDPNSTLGDYLGSGSSGATALASNLATSPPSSTDLFSSDSTDGTTDATTSGTFDWSWLLWAGAAALVAAVWVSGQEG